MAILDVDRQSGRIFTKNSPFKLKAFLEWLPKHAHIIDPFAGDNSLIAMLKADNLGDTYHSFDIEPRNNEVKERNSLINFPMGYNVCVTNPPWLHANSATKRKLNKDWDGKDIYLQALKQCLYHCPYTACLLPASFMNNKGYVIAPSRLHSLVLIHKDLFQETRHPTCLALFTPKIQTHTKIYYDNSLITNSAINTCCLKQPFNTSDFKKFKFNDPSGDLVLSAVDTVKEKNIKFIARQEVKNDLKNTNRVYVQISGFLGDLGLLNKNLAQFRKQTHDIALTPIFGKRNDGGYRRRLSFTLARYLMAITMFKKTNNLQIIT